MVRRKIYILVIATAFQVRNVNGQAMTIDNLAVTVTAPLTLTVSGDFKNQNGGTIANAGTMTVSGNWTNNASNSVFSTSNGTVLLDGTSAQTIGGTSSTSFYNLTLNNSSAAATRYPLGINQNITNTLTMSAGELDLATYTLTLGSSAALPGTLTYTAGWMYGGTLRRWIQASAIATGAASGLFPVGSSADYRPLWISTSVNPTVGGTISVSHTSIANTTVSSFLDIDITIDRIFNSYWTVTTGNGFLGGTYNMRTDGTGFTGVNDYTTLRLVQPGSAVGLYGTNGGNNSNPQVNRTTLLLTDLSNQFYWGYPAGSGPLPIELISFNAVLQQPSVKLNWTTATEINSDYFDVQRSVDGIIFEKILSQPAAGNSFSNRYYTAADINPPEGLIYYRLKETDFDGSITYSPIATVYFEKPARELEIISATSANDQVAIQINSPYDEKFELNLCDATGRLVAEMKGTLQTGCDNIYNISSAKAKDLYFIILKTSRQTLVKKVI